VPAVSAPPTSVNAGVVVFVGVGVGAIGVGVVGVGVGVGVVAVGVGVVAVGVGVGVGVVGVGGGVVGGGVGVVGVVTVAGLTVIVTFAVAVLAGDSPSPTDTPTVEGPALVGVPLIVSVAPFAVAVSPSGSPVAAAHVYGPCPPDTVAVPEYPFWPTVATAGTSAVILSGIDVPGADLTVMGMLAVAVMAGDSPSLTDTPTRKRPASVGVPLIVSVVPSAYAVSPSGSPVAAAHVYGPCPPDTVAVPEYPSSPTVASAGTSAVILSGPPMTMTGLTVMGMSSVAVLPGRSLSRTDT
jgi:hypothetical protein